MFSLATKKARCYVMDRAIFGPGLALSEGQVVVIPANVEAPKAITDNARQHYGDDPAQFPHGALVWDDVAYHKATNPKPEPSRPPVLVTEPEVLKEFGWTTRELQLAMAASFPAMFSQNVGMKSVSRTWQRSQIDNWLVQMRELGFERVPR